ncbi:hypothetical protein BJV82DRAFT_658352 [Fennellomyces sp. T-0311]|nr:hypothetical protein BJV82DRAFT_658352 [Fennellomyces sp. T-0311]
MCTATPLRTLCRRHSGLSAVGRCAVTKSSYPARSVVQRVASRPPWVVKLLSLLCISQNHQIWSWPLGKLNVHRPAKIPQDTFVRVSYLEKLTRGFVKHSYGADGAKNHIHHIQRRRNELVEHPYGAEVIQNQQASAHKQALENYPLKKHPYKAPLQASTKNYPLNNYSLKNHPLKNHPYKASTQGIHRYGSAKVRCSNKTNTQLLTNIQFRKKSSYAAFGNMMLKRESALSGQNKHTHFGP